MRIAVSADTLLGVASLVPKALETRGHEVILHGALCADTGAEIVWAAASAAAARDVVEGRADQALVCCFTGTGATIAANKVEGVRAALCVDAFTAAGARRWNNANVLGLSLRLVTEQLLTEILDAWFATSDDGSQQASLRFLDTLEADRVAQPAL